MRELYLCRVPDGKYGTRRCPVCRRPAFVYYHPNPLRGNIRVYRCKKHNRVRFVPLDEKQGLGGGVYR